LDNSIDNAIDAILEAILAEEGRMSPKKKLVVEAAVLSFAEQGYDATSTRMIAERAGVAEATIFRHFGTKKALLMRIAEPVVKRLLAPAAAEEAILLREQSTDVRMFVRAIMLSRLAFADKYAPLVRIVLQEYSVNADLRAMLKKHVGAVLAKISSETIVSFKASGQIRDLPPERLLRWVMSLLGGYYLNRSILAAGDWDDEAEVDAILDILWNGIKQE
jgi:AcrR family transcriptional regulator